MPVIEIDTEDAIRNVTKVSTRICNKREEWIAVTKKILHFTNAGADPLNRPLQKHINYGVIVIDKPPGPTSHEVVAWIKKMLNIEKAGHGGTLEPFP